MSKQYLHSQKQETSVFVLFFVVIAFAILATTASAETVVYSDDMESGVNGWIADGLWHRATDQSSSPSYSWAYNDGVDYDTGVANSGSLMSPWIDLTGVSGATLTFDSWYQTESTGTYWDKKLVYISVDGINWTLLLQVSGTMNVWTPQTIDLSAYDGQTVHLKFVFDTVDSILNNYKGWYVDDVVITGAGGAPPSTPSASFEEDVESGVNGWSANGLWHIAGDLSSSPTHSWAYNDGVDYDTGVANSGSLISPWIDLSTAVEAELSFKSWYQTESTSTYWDRKKIHVSTDGVNWSEVGQVSGTMNAWTTQDIDLSGYAGETIKIKFTFETIDSLYNNYKGWYIDDIQVLTVSFDPVTEVAFRFEEDEERFVAGTESVLSLQQTAALAYEGSGSLQMNVLLQSGSKAEIYRDMLNCPPYGVQIPVNLQGQTIKARVYCPTGSKGYTSGPRGIQVFAKDENWKSQYGTWSNITENGWIEVTLSPSTTTPVWGYTDPGFDPTRIRTIGVVVGGGSTYAPAYQGPIYVDAIEFGVEPVEPVVNENEVRYSFDLTEEGFAASDYEFGQAITSVQQVEVPVAHGDKGCLQLNVELDGQSTTHGSGEAYVDMQYFPPQVVRAPFDLEGQEVSVYVYCPEGSSGGCDNPNGLQLFVKDGNWLGEAGTWTPLVEGTWQKVTLTPSTIAPVNGHMDAGFDPSDIRSIGIKIGTADGSTATYTGPIYVDAFSFPAEVPIPPPTQHMYSFDDPASPDFPYWDTDPEGWDAHAWDTVYIDAQEQALAADAVFQGEGAAYGDRKGVFLIAYNPALNLSTKDHRIIHAKLKFDPPVEGLLCFNASIAVYDKSTDQWYTKNFQVGGAGWNVMMFDLDDPAEYDSGSPVPMATAEIGFVAIQLFANCPYTGKVLVDDVTVGGVEIPGYYEPIEGGIVQQVGNQFMLDGEPFYFAGANIEYLTQVTVNDTLADELFGVCEDMHIRCVRTWAFHEGEPYSFQPEPGVWNESAFEKLDRMIAMAGNRGIRLMLGLVDNWAHNGGMFKYMEWVQELHPESLPPELQGTNMLGTVALHDQFYDNAYAKQWYKNYVTKLLTRTNTITGVAYKDDPTIFGWEIVNEPRCATEMDSGRPFGTWVHNWIREMSDFVASVDGNHMLAAGEEGGYIVPFAEANEREWQSFPRNYWIYGLQAETNWGAGAMADFLSDYSSEPTWVEWQTGTKDNPGPVQGEWRSGVSNVHFCPFRLYVDDKEYNMHMKDYNGYDQRYEWIAEHTDDAHNYINKPLILEEFGFHAYGWSYQGYYGELQYVPIPKMYLEDRVQAYAEVYQIIEDLNVNGSFFWNLGYEGLWEDDWDMCEQVGSWYADGSSDATGVTLETTEVQEGNAALKMTYNPANGTGKAIFSNITNEQWLVRVDGDQVSGINRVKYFWNVYNPGTTIHFALALKTGDNWDWNESATQELRPGWNKILIDLSAGTWKNAASGWQHNSFLIDVLDDVRQVNVVLYGDNGVGNVVVDNVTIKRDDGFVIYPDDPVCDVIRAHADYMNAK